jgi:hypothetical protein
VAVGEAIDGDFYGVVDDAEFFVGQARALVADDEGCAGGEAEFVDALRVCRLFERDELVALLAQLAEDRRQRAVDFECDLICAGCRWLGQCEPVR